MTQQKDFKRIVRARMQKTGESYTSARAIVLSKRKSRGPAVKATTNGRAASNNKNAAAPPSQWPAIAGMSDEKVKAATGRTWAKWVSALDDVGAYKMSHKDIAALLGEKYGVRPWWAQGVTVGYERIRGLRERGQRCDGAFEASKSKTFAVSASDLYAMFSPRTIKRWLPTGIAKDRGGTANRTVNLDWEDGTKALFSFVAKGPGKCSVAVQHTKLKSKDDIPRRKAFWTERFEALASALK